MTQILHPQANSKPKLLVAEPKRQGGQLSARCECGWYCKHNHKSFPAAQNCVEKHALTVGG